MIKKHPVKLGAAILAGGKSTRYNGLNKALLKISGKTILERNIQTMRPLFDEIHIISNTPEDFKFTELNIFKDVYQNIGPLGGIYTALLNSECEAVFIFSCDMPFLSINMIKNIKENFIMGNCQILIPEINNKIEPLHAVYSSSILETLENHIRNTDQYKIRLFFQKVSTSYYTVQNTSENQKAFLNINSPEDLLIINSLI